MIQLPGLQRTIQILLLFILGFAGLYYAKPFLVPVCMAGLFAMLFLPLCRKLEKSALNRGLASLFCILLLLIIIAGVILLITWQIKNLTEDLGNMEAKIREAWRYLSDFISRTLGISREQQEQVIDDQSEKASGGIGKLGTILLSLVVDFVLMIVYIFLFLFYRRRIKNFILKIVPKKADDNTESAIDDIKKISQKYLTGVGLMILCLWIMYSIGFSIVGLKHAIFFAILCGLFEIVPFVGNFVGNMLAILMAVTQGGGSEMVIGIIITYALIQFLQTYLLEPLVVGNEVNLNPLFTIIALVIGELVWGIAGLVLAIPLLGIVKIVCDHIPTLQPYGYLMGSEKKNKKNLWEIIKSKFTK